MTLCSFRIAIAGQYLYVAILTGFLVIQLVGTVYTELLFACNCMQRKDEPTYRIAAVFCQNWEGRSSVGLSAAAELRS